MSTVGRMGRHRAEDCVVIVPRHGVITDGTPGGGWLWSRTDDEPEPAPTLGQLAPRIERARRRAMMRP
jgi:hypothetical protein